MIYIILDERSYLYFCCVNAVRIMITAFQTAIHFLMYHPG